MINIASEFRAVSYIYLHLEQELEKMIGATVHEDPADLVEATLASRDCLDRVEQMHSRLLELSAKWKKCRTTLAPETREEIGRLSEVIRARAIRLSELCGIQTGRLEKIREKLGMDLAELEKGAQYLRSIKPAKGNYPKFIDSLY